MQNLSIVTVKQINYRVPRIIKNEDSTDTTCCVAPTPNSQNLGAWPCQTKLALPTHQPMYVIFYHVRPRFPGKSEFDHYGRPIGRESTRVVWTPLPLGHQLSKLDLPTRISHGSGHPLYTLKDFKNEKKNEFFFFLHPEHFMFSLTGKINW